MGVKPIVGGVAQLGEHLPCTQKVAGSKPVISTRIDPVGARRIKPLLLRWYGRTAKSR